MESHIPQTSDEEILASGFDDVIALRSDKERIGRIAEELTGAFAMLKDVGPCFTIFGSARTTADDADYLMTYQTAKALSKEGWGVITGGGPGAMEAANKGAYDGGTASIGLGIELPFEHAFNPYCTLTYDFHYFFTRKFCLSRYSSGYIVAPGGVGTFDELFEILTLMQTQKVHDHLPVVLLGKDYWRGMLDWMQTMPYGQGKIDVRDFDRLFLADSAQEVIDYVKEVAPIDPHA